MSRSAAAVVFAAVALSSASVTAATFTVTGAATTPGGHNGDAILSGVSFGTGPSFGAADLRYASSVTAFSYAGGAGEMRVVSGPQTSKTNADATVNVTGLHRLETSGDADAASVSAADQFAFGAHIAAAFQNRNLNNYLDLIPSQHFAFTVNFATPLRDNDSGDDAFGELLLFERGFGGSNSYMLMAVDGTGNTVGQLVTVGQVLIDPRSGTFAPQPLSPRTSVAIYDAAGNVIGSQEMEGVAIDISAAFGVDEITALRIATPLATDAGVDASGGYDRAPDFKLLGLDTSAAGGNRTQVPEPGALLVLPACAVALLGGRRRRG